MRPIDFTPFQRSTIGFDRLFQLLDGAQSFDAEQTYPPYNIERLTETDYRISMAVAGFTESELKIEMKDTVLIVRGDKFKDDDGRHFLHRGIAARSFERRFQLADHVEVKSAALKDGLLDIALQRNVPERLKPRTIPISVDGAPKQISATTATPAQ